MSKEEKENRINSLAVTFLERQQIQPNIFADQIVRGYKEGYHQAEKDVVESFARIVCGNLSMIDKSIQDKFEQLYTDIIGEKMYKGFKD